MSITTRSRKSTIASQVSTAQLLQGAQPQPTAELFGDERTRFEEIIQARELATWTPHDLAVATSLAQILTEIADLHVLVREQGLMIEHERKGLIPHPALATIVSLTGSAKSLQTTLGVSAAQRGISGSKQARRNVQEQGLRSSFADTGIAWA